MDHIVYIGVGSNLGDRKARCKEAVGHLDSHPKINLIAVSNWHETAAVTLREEKQPNYINGALKITTSLTPTKLLKSIKEIEHKMGRSASSAQWSAREIDLDILFYDNIVISSRDLIIPHPEIEKRMFVLKPLCDIEPRLFHPVLKKTIQELCLA